MTKGVPKRRQGLVYYAMLNKEFANPQIIKICMDAINFVCNSEYDRRMLYEFVTTDKTAVAVGQKYFCTERKIQKLFRKYMARAIESITNV